MSAEYEAKAVAKSSLEQAVRDFIEKSKLNGNDKDETVSEIIDAVCDGSDREIIFKEP
jgi:hypothetical protein